MKKKNTQISSWNKDVLYDTQCWNSVCLNHSLIGGSNDPMQGLFCLSSSTNPFFQAEIESRISSHSNHSKLHLIHVVCSISTVLYMHDMCVTDLRQATEKKTFEGKYKKNNYSSKEYIVLCSKITV